MSFIRVVIACYAVAVALAQCSGDSCEGQPEDAVTLMQLVSHLKERPQRTDLDHKVRLTQRYIQEETGDGDGDGDGDANSTGHDVPNPVAEVFHNYESPSSYIFNITGQALPYGRANFTITVTTTTTTTTVCDNTTNCTLFLADNNDTSFHNFDQELMPDTTTSTVSMLLFAATTIADTTTATSTWPTIFAPAGGMSTMPPLGAFNPNQPGGQYPVAPISAYPLNISDGNITDNNGMTNISINGTAPDVPPPGAQIMSPGVAVPMAPVLPPGVAFNLPTPVPPYAAQMPTVYPGVPMGAPPGVPVYSQGGSVLPPPAVPAAPPAPPSTKSQLTPLQKVFNRAIQQGA